jgi:type IV pilus assembly protein PilF
VTRMLLSLALACIVGLTLTACSIPAPPASMNITHPNEAAGRFNAEQGLFYLHSGDTIVAHEKFVLALEQAPTDPLTLDAAAFYYEKTGDLTLANNTFFYALLLAPNSGTIRNNYGAFLCRNGYSHESILYFMKSAKTPHYADAAEAYANAKFCAERLGDKAEYAYYTKLLRNPIPTQVLQ